MFFYKNIRYLLLLLSFSITLLTLEKIVISPPQKQKQVASFTLADTVLLPGWKQIKSKTLLNKPGKIYQYKQGSHQLTVEMHYETGLEDNGDLFIENSPEITLTGELKSVVRYKQDVGSYSLSTQKGQAYLRSCIPAHGQATILYGQFVYDRYKSDFRVDRLASWISGKKPLMDYRCLWVHLSVPYDNNSPELAYQLLENTWVTWYEYWQSRFPES